MKPMVEGDLTMRKYLLGELSQEEQSEVEERLFLDSEYFQRLQMFEDDLIDDYVYEELSPDEREKFDNYFLSNPERYESLRIAQALKKYTSSNPSSIPSVSSSGDASQTALSKIAFLPFWRVHNPALRLSMAAAMLLIALGGLWLIIRAIRPSGILEPDHTQQAQEQQQAPRSPSDANRQDEHRAETKDDVERLPEQPAGQQNQDRPVVATKREKEAAQTSERRKQVRESRTPNGESSAQVYSFLLLPIGQVRDGGEVNKVDIPSNAGAVNLQLPLIEETNYTSYQAALNTLDDKSVQTWKGLKPTQAESGKIVSIRVPTKLLRQQAYKVRLSGLTANGSVRDIGSYTFQLSKR
jgi:hypothetical protein